MTTENVITLNINSNIIANSRITLQEESDRWGLLYDPHIDFSLGINPESVFLWRQMENKTTIKDIAAKIKGSFTDVPIEIEKEVTQIVQGFLKLGFITVIPDEISNTPPEQWGMRGER
jgi:hypothetical protein